jgi:DNA mismatch repair protein MutH
VEGTQYTTREDILRHAREAIGKPLREIDKTGRLETGKGAIGTVIEESWFGYRPNSEAEPDFPEAGVELKVTPYIRTERGIRAKERLVCNIIDYMREYEKTFKTSSFWHKCATMLLMSYEHRADVPKGDFTIDEAILFSFPEEDLVIIEQDWAAIMAKIRAGQAHLLSEGDTFYLAACTKGANAQSVRSQPFSDIPAKQRAYSLKSSYMTLVLNKYIFGSVENEHIIKNLSDVEGQTFADYITEKLKPYFGLSQNQLKEKFGVDSSAKNLGEMLLARMLGIKGKIAYTDEFQKASIVPKTIRVREDGSIKESMSFPTFDFIRLSKESSWEESEFYEYLAPTKFLFVIFQQTAAGELIFSRIKFWNIPAQDLDEVGRVWERTVEAIRAGVILTPTESGVKNNLPKQSESRVAHVRPHGRNAEDTLPLPDGRMMTKQCFWLNNTYIAEQIL